MNLKYLGINNNSKSFIVFLIIFFIHLFCINLYPINDEFIFPVGAKLLETGNLNIIKNFFTFNANTLGFSGLIFLFSKFIPLSFYYIGKLLSCSGIILIFIGINNLLKILKIDLNRNSHLLILLILLNPIIFTFSFRATPDFFSAALSFFSITCFIINKRFLLKLLFLTLFSIAVIIKPFNAIMIFLIFYNFNFNFKKSFCKKNIILFLWFLASLFIPVIFLIYNFYLFNFFLIPEQYKLIKSVNFLNFFISFISYLGFLNLFILPLYIDYCFNILKRNTLKTIFYILISVAASLLFMDAAGEINFGFLQAFLNYDLFYFILVFSFCILFDFIYFFINQNNSFKKIFLFFILFALIFIFILSNFLPSQRYLLIILPLFLSTFFIITKNNFLCTLTISLYILINSILFLNHYSMSHNIKNVIIFLEKNKLIQETNPAFLGQHALNYFIDFNKDKNNFMNIDVLLDKNKKYYVSDIEPKNKMNILFISTSHNIFKKNRNLFVLKNNF